jgi:ubiquinone/menaquinone biosynthesis C-methylase UbiE
VVADPSETLIQKGKRKFSQIKYVQTSVEQLPFQDNSYDVVLMIGMLHFTSDPELALREAARVLKPGGTLLISDINFANPLNKFIIKPIKTAVISKVNSFSPEEIDTILLKYNFKSKRHTAADFVVSAVKY